MAAAGTRGMFAKGVLPFALKNGNAAIIAPAERRTFDHIINVNVGVFPVDGLTDNQAKLILSKSRLPEADLESIWRLTDSLDAQGLPDGSWTALEIYVALHYVQAAEGLSLNQMALHFAGSMPPEVTGEIRRRSSYANAGIALLPETNHQMSSSTLPPGFVRAHSVSAKPGPSGAASLRHTASDAATSTRAKRIHATHALSNLDESSISQAGLEALGPLREDISTDQNHHNEMLRSDSIRTETTSLAQRLNSLIRSRCPQVHIDPDIESFEPRSPEVGLVDRLAARDVLVRKRREDPNFKDPSIGFGKLFKSKRSKEKASDINTWDFKGHELSTALREAVEESGNIGVAKQLIDMSADVNFFKQASKPSKLRGLGSTLINQVPINYAKIAALRNNPDMVSLFATHGASPSNLVETLDQAVRQNLPKIVLVLLQHGVDPNALDGSIFASAVASQNPTLIRLLLRARNKIAPNVLTRNLPIAVSQEQVEVVSLLVLYGADTRYENALALRKAVQAQRIDLVLAIVKAGVDSMMVSSVVGDAFLSGSSLPALEQYLLIDILLCAGAKGDPVAQLLVPVVRKGDQKIAKLLVIHGANIQYNCAEALRIAVASRNVEMLSTLLLGDISESAVGTLVDEIPHSCKDNRSYELISRLVTKGAKGDPLHRALVRAVQHKKLRTIGLLLDHKASVNFEGSQALRIAVTEGQLAIVELLLNKGRPHPGSMELLLPLVPPSQPHVRYQMTKSIISTAGQIGISTSVLDEALLDALNPRFGEPDRILVDSLITAGAKVDSRKGKPFRLVAEHGSIELLKLLIQNLADPFSLCGATAASMKIENAEHRRNFIDILLRNGLKGPDVDHALVDAIEENPMDKRLVQLLLDKASVKYQEGRALAAAIRCSSADLVASIIDTHRTNPHCRQAALPVIFEPDTRDRGAKLRLLLQAGLGERSINEALIREISGERHSDIVRMLLSYNASSDYDDGKSMGLAINFQDHAVLEQLAASSQDCNVLSNLIPPAMRIKDGNSRRTSMDVLLRGGASGQQVDEALSQEVESPERRDSTLIQFLVKSGARIDYCNARAIKYAVSIGTDLELLNILVSGTGASSVLPFLVPLAMNHNQDLRLPLLRILLDKGVHGEKVDTALIKAVSEGTQSKPTIDLLLRYDASVNHKDAQAMKVAALAGNYALLGRLLRKNPNPKHISTALNLAMQSPPAKSTASTHGIGRLNSVKLLTNTKGTQPEVLHWALLQAVKEKDHDLVEHLISSGADCNFKDGQSVVAATEELDLRSLHLLLRSKPTTSTCSQAFVVMPQGVDRWQDKPILVNGFDIVLIPGGAKGSAVDQTFLSALSSPLEFAAKFIGMVLSCWTPLDANFLGGKSLCIAVKNARFEVLDYLLSQRPNRRTLRAAFMAIFESNLEENALITLAQRFFEHSGSEKHIYFEQDDPSSDALYQTLHRHSNKANLLLTLLDNGCAPESRFSWIFKQSIGSEPISALLWILCQGNECIDDNTLQILLDRGADPNFRTGKTGQTPLLTAAGSAPPGIVLQLLDAGAEPDMQDEDNYTPLEYATMAGTTESMKHLLKAKADISDESLHIAARQLDVSAADILLEHGASAVLPGAIHCGGRTPLGELCCMANLQQNPPQLKKTLKRLFDVTSSLTGASAHRSLVFDALNNDSPLKMATALLTACPAMQQSLNEDINIHSEDGRYYSLTAYLRHSRCIESPKYRSTKLSDPCCTINVCPAPALERLLRAYGCKDRYWDDTSGANQPQGFCNPPNHILTAINEAEVQRRELARQARLKLEEEGRQRARDAAEKARLDKMQAAKDAEVAAELRRERQRLKFLEDERAAEARAEKQRVDAAVQEKRQMAEAEAEAAYATEQRRQAEYTARKERERRDFSDEQRKVKELAQVEERALRERGKISIAQRREEAKLQKGLMDREAEVWEGRRRAIDSATGWMRQAEFSKVAGGGSGGQQGFGGREMGRILWES